MIINTPISVLVAALVATGAIPTQVPPAQVVAHIAVPDRDGTTCDPRGVVEPDVLLTVAPVPGWDQEPPAERTPAQTGQFA
jgi:hypothetical protein